MDKGAVLNVTQKHSLSFLTLIFLQCEHVGSRLYLSYSKKLNTTHLEQQNYQRTAANCLDCYGNSFTVIITTTL